MEELVILMKVLLANQTFMYNKAHVFHWNVEGIEFPQYHGFFGELYGELYSAIDPIAEQIRALGEYAPTSIHELYNYKTVEEETSLTTNVKSMLTSLQNDNNKVIENLNKVLEAATKQNKQGLINFIADRIDTHNKHGWMLRSCLK